jgi:hypothetical protein
MEKPQSEQEPTRNEEQDTSMDIEDIPAVADNIAVADAFDRVVQSGHSVLLVHTDHRPHLYSAEALHAAVQAGPNITVGELARVTGAPNLLEAEGVELLAIDSGRARVRVPATLMFDAMNLAVGIHSCSAKPTHSYYDWELAGLNKDINGNYICNFDSTIVK